MHIAFWSPAWPLQRFQNGIITYVHVMKIELERLGHRVSVFTPILDKSNVDNGIYHVDVGKQTLWSKATRRLLQPRSFLESNNQWLAGTIASAILEVHAHEAIDVIEMEESFGWFAEVQRVTSLPLVVKLHGPAFLSYVGSELEAPFAQSRIDIEGKALAHASSILSPCLVTLSQTLERYDLSPSIVGHIVNPMVVDNAIPLWTLEACDRSTLLFVGRFDLRKGADIVLQAFILLLAERPQLKLVFVGPDTGLPLSDGKRIQFNAYCDEIFPSALRKQIDYRGAMANGEIADLRVKAFATIVASRWENPGYTLLEAMMQACPVVASNAGGCPEVVTDGVTGRLAKSEEPADFANKIRSLLDNPESAATMARAGRRFVLDIHSAENVVRKSVAIYESAIQMRRH